MFIGKKVGQEVCIMRVWRCMRLECGLGSSGKVNRNQTPQELVSHVENDETPLKYSKWESNTIRSVSQILFYQNKGNGLQVSKNKDMEIIQGQVQWVGIKLQKRERMGGGNIQINMTNKSNVNNQKNLLKWIANESGEKAQGLNKEKGCSHIWVQLYTLVV